MNKQIIFEGVKGYVSYENARKRGEEVAKMLDSALDSPIYREYFYRWMIVAKPDGRYLPVFAANNLPGGPGMLLGEVNVGVIN